MWKGSDMQFNFLMLLPDCFTNYTLCIYIYVSIIPIYLHSIRLNYILRFIQNKYDNLNGFPLLLNKKN